MSAGANSFHNLPPDQEVLGELLHSLSQPLTSLRCSLELSMDDPAEQQQRVVSTALLQTNAAIGMVQLMREYLDAEKAPDACPIALMPILSSVVEDLSSIAEMYGVRLRMAGTCASEMRVAKTRVRLAFQYLILAVIERQSPGGEITLFLGEGPAGTVLRARCARPLVLLQTSVPGSDSGIPALKHDSIGATTCRVRMAIAARIFAAAGAFLAFDDGTPGFVLRIPRLCSHKG